MNRRAIAEQARVLGFSLFGVTAVEPSEHTDFYRSWIASGYHGEMTYLGRQDAIERRAEPSLTMPDASSLIVVGHEYYQRDPSGTPEEPSRAVIARYARGRDYHRVVKKRLERLLAWLDAHVDGGVRGRAYVDTGPILEREIGRRAGLGWFGRNSMLIHPTRGSYFFLGTLFVDLELPADEAFEEDRCGTCRACLDACPTGALLGRDAAGAPVMDATRCISYLTIEHRGSIPRELRPSIGNRIFGCDICQEVCPFNERFAEQCKEPDYQARSWRPERRAVRDGPDGHPADVAPMLVELLEIVLDEAAWDELTRGSAVRRAGRAGLARNVCVALGNWGAADAVRPLLRALHDPEPLVRGHAAWALGGIDSAESRAGVLAAAAEERDPSALEEMSWALGRGGS